MNEKQTIYQARSLPSQASEGFISHRLAHANIFFFSSSSGTVKNRKVVGLLSLGSDFGIKTSFLAFGPEQMQGGEEVWEPDNRRTLPRARGRGATAGYHPRAEGRWTSRQAR